MAFRSVKIIFRNSDGLSKTIYFKQNVGIAYPTPAPEVKEVTPPISNANNLVYTDETLPLLPPIVIPKITPAMISEGLANITLPKISGGLPEITLPDIDLSTLANLNLPPFDASQIKLDFETYPINIKPFGPITIPKNIGIPGPTGDAGAMKFNPMLQGINSIFGQYGG